MAIPSTVFKAQATGNDFVMYHDPEGVWQPTDEETRWLCDRHFGVGADGLLRLTEPRFVSDLSVEQREECAQGGARWFMDYRNADGSLAEMCGNGTRVFATYLRREGLESADEFEIATRDGIKGIRFDGDLVATDMGEWRFPDPEKAEADGFDALVHVTGHSEPWSALSVDMGNPHTVVALPEGVELDDLDLLHVPDVRPVPEHGTNVEFVKVLAPGHIVMRVHERGVGETRSCGTGVCAAALATSFWAGDAEPTRDWIVDVPGGRLRVRALPGHRVELAGPAELVADGTVDLTTL